MISDKDDCLPAPSFFRFCHELLEKYHDDERVMHITGSNYQLGRSRTPDSYFYSQFPIGWGWASWRRAWRYFDATMGLWPTVRDSHMLDWVLDGRTARTFWSQRFQDIHDGTIREIWDIRWWFACWIQNGLSIHPDVNMISNIGFDDRATHIKKPNRFANLAAHDIEFPLRHPATMICNSTADHFIQRTVFTPSTASK